MIIRYPDSKLRAICLPVPINLGWEEYQEMAGDLILAMLAEDGAGLAAPQIGLTGRVFVIHERIAGAPNHEVFFNPEIIYRSPDKEDGEEGCLSFPGGVAVVKRSIEVHVRVLNVQATLAAGEERTKVVEAAGLYARAIQHENDHLDGITLINYVPSTRRGKFIKSLRK